MARRTEHLHPAFAAVIFLAALVLLLASLSGCAGTATTPTIPVTNTYHLHVTLERSPGASVTIDAQDKQTTVTASNAADADNAPDVDAEVPLGVLP